MSKAKSMRRSHLNDLDLPLFAKSTSAMNVDTVSEFLDHRSCGTQSKKPIETLVREFSDFGQNTVETTEDGITYFINEFWTSAQRKSHSIHEISYRACFKSQLPNFFIKHLTMPGDWIYDPFMGRGTTLVEASLLGRRPAGNDINPLSTILTRPRLRPASLANVSKILCDIDWNTGKILDSELLTFYSENTLKHIYALRTWLFERAPLDTIPEPEVDWIRMVAINRLTGHSSGFFSVYTLPPNQAVSLVSQKKINKSRNQTPPDRDIIKIILKKTKSLLADGTPPTPADYLLSVAPSNQTPVIPSASISLVVTSPPFLDIVQYADDNWLRCWFAGINSENVKISHLRTGSAWQEMVRETLKELSRVVRPGGYVAFEVGEVRKGKVLLEKLVWEAAQGLPFERLFVMINKQNFTKTANCWGITNNNSGTNSNRIVLLRRTGE